MKGSLQLLLKISESVRQCKVYTLYVGTIFNMKGKFDIKALQQLALSILVCLDIWAKY